MNKFFKIFGLLSLVLLLSSTANALTTVTDVQDATNWGNYFLPDNTDPYSSPYYRFDDGNWGWTHMVNFGGAVTDVSDIISATLSIVAWDVDESEYDLIYADNNYQGYLTLDHHGAWYTTTFTLDAAALQDLVDGTLDIDMIIDTAYDHRYAVTLKSSTLSVDYVPAPGAILLAGMGASLVGWLRRRRTL